MTNIVRLTPEPMTAIIDESDVSPARLASVLESAVIDHRIDDGDIYASSGLEFPVWISIVDDKKLLSFFTFVASNEAPPSDPLSRVNEINKVIVVVQFHWNEERLWGHYWMTYEGGIDIKHFIKMLRRFSGAFEAGASRFFRGD